MSLAVIAALAIVAAATHSTNNSNSSDIAPITGFGGYNWTGPVSQISAQWNVPTIAATSPEGNASTWIGAQNVTGGYPFIQLGITEDKYGPYDIEYEAFWSDTEESFHPQSLGVVYAGDVIRASMQRMDGDWILAFDDTTHTLHSNTRVRYAVGTAFTQGEWIQEDPTATNVVSVDLPYPAMSNVRFQRLLVDGHPPKLTLVDGQTLSATGGIDRTPTAVHDDSFTFYDPTGAAKQYLKDATQLDGAVAKFNVAFATWKNPPTNAQVKSVRELAAAINKFSASVGSQTWPLATRPYIKPLIAQDQQDARALTTWAASGGRKAASSFVNVLLSQDGSPWVNKVRSSVGLPPP
jgi:hypothetical protein